MEVKLPGPALLGNYDTQNKQPTDRQPTNQPRRTGRPGHIEVFFPQ